MKEEEEERQKQEAARLAAANRQSLTVEENLTLHFGGGSIRIHDDEKLPDDEEDSDFDEEEDPEDTIAAIDPEMLESETVDKLMKMELPKKTKKVLGRQSLYKLPKSKEGKESLERNLRKLLILEDNADGMFVLSQLGVRMP